MMNFKMLSLFFISLCALAGEEVYVTVGTDALPMVQSKFKTRMEHISSEEQIAILKTDEGALPYLSLSMHREFNRCGGFMVHKSKEAAMDAVAEYLNWQKNPKTLSGINYKITKDGEVKNLLKDIDEKNILDTITKLSSFVNRFYKGQEGKKSAQYIKDLWSEMSKSRNDIAVEFVQHAKWDQPSVVMTMKGHKNPEKIIVLGGHQDSINVGLGGRNAMAKAPGADDNASGIATITETIRVLLAHNYEPSNTIKFMAYAAEEVGLLGSSEIADKYKKSNAQVMGVMQLDMTNFKGSREFDIVLMTDYTSSEQNKFVEDLIKYYIPNIKVGHDSCGYGCSDHASWTLAGYPASIPFEATMSTMNHDIHTTRDTLDKSNNNAIHAKKFALLSTSFVVELDK